MRTAKGVTVLCVLGLAAAATVAPAANQENAEKMPKTSERKLSGTRDASAIVKITTDPDIIVLNPETVEALLRSSDVGQKAAHEVLGPDTEQGAYRIAVEWLSQDSRGVGEPPALSSSAAETEQRSYQKQMMRQLREIYGEQYMNQYGIATNEYQKNEGNETTQGGRTAGTQGRAGRGTRGRSAAEAVADALYGTTGRARRGYDAMGPGSAYGVPARSGVASDFGQSVMIQLGVHLPENVRPAARELMKALVENLRENLWQAYETYEGQLAELVRYEEDRRDTAQGRFEEAIGARPDRSEGGTQLDIALHTTVDPSAWVSEMPFVEAIEVLKYAVEPPLPLVVRWKELAERCEIERSTTVDMDGLPPLQLETALKTLLKAVSGGLADVSYQIDGDVIFVGVGEEESQTLQPAPGRPGAETDVKGLATLRRDLVRDVQRLEMDLTGMQARRQAIQEQIARTETEVERRIAGDEVTQQLEDILAMTVRALTQEEGQYASQHPALERSEAIRQLREQVARAKIELAKRREEIARSAGGARLEMFSGDLSQIAIDSAEKQAQLGVLRRQIEETQQELVRASKLDPQAARIRIAKETLDIAERQVAELKTRLLNLQPPTVTMIGLN